jgi:hypothetical protein
MAKNTPAAGNDVQASKRPLRNPKPTATLLEHSEGAALPSQQRKINEYKAAAAAKQQCSDISAAASTATTPAASPTPSSILEYPSSPDVRQIGRSSSGKRKATVEDSEDSDDEGDIIDDGISDELLSKCMRVPFELLVISSANY